MKNTILKIFVGLFVVICSPAFGFVVGDPKCDTSNSNISACQNNLPNGPCSVSGSAEGHCVKLDGCLKCVVYECKANYLLVMKNGKSMGYCTSKASAEKNCSSKGCKVKYTNPPRKPDVKDGAWDGCICDENNESTVDENMQQVIECVKPEHAVSVSGIQPNCNVDQCESGWLPSDDKKSCVEGESEKSGAGDTAVSSSGESQDGANTENNNATRTENSGESSESFSKQDSKPKERTDEEKAAALAEKKSAWDDAKENEQSVANRTLTAATTAATGIGAMQLAQGLTEQKADAAADRDMTAYIATMRCSYADGKSVKAGAEEIELPGGNDANIMQYRNEYFALASSLKERKESLGMKPGIESEAILDKADMGLYDDENVGISGGNYASLYRAKTGSEADQALITSEQEKSANRVKYGGIALGAGAAVGIVGNSLINGKLGEWIKGAKEDSDSKKKEDVALKKLKQCMKDAGAKNYDKLKFSKFTPSVLNLDGIDCKKDLTHLKGKDATTLFADSEDGDVITKKLVESFGESNAAAMLGKVYPGVSAYVEGQRENVQPIADRVEYTATGGVKQTRFESDKDYGDGTGYCYNFIDGFVRGNISGAGCSSLEPGDWMTSFENGNVRGVSVCSLVRPEGMSHGFTPNETVQAQIQNSYDLWVKNGRQRPNDDDEMGCYCKMNGGGRWVFDSYWSGYHCKTACAYFCAYLVGDAGQQAFREAVLKKY